MSSRENQILQNYNEVISMIEQAKNRVNSYVNRELIEFYRLAEDSLLGVVNDE